LDKAITYLINSLGGGGAEGVCVTLANRMAALGWRVNLIVLHLESAVHLQRLRQDVELTVLGKRHSRTAALSLYKVLKKNKPEKVLIFNQQLAVLLIILRSLFGLNYVTISRNINTLSEMIVKEKSFWHKYFVNFIVRIFYHRGDYFIAQSKGMADDLIKKYNVEMRKISIINNPINPFLVEKSHENNFKKGNYLLCVGRLEEAKAFQYAISAFSRIIPLYSDLRLKIVGIGTAEGALKALSKQLGVADRVDFEGYQNDVADYYLGARATLLTSYYEGFPNVLVESIALGTPVVAFDCPSGPSEIIIDGVNGFLVKYLDEVCLETCLKEVLEKNWDIDAIKNTSKRFSPERIVDEYVEIIDSLKSI